MRVRAGRKPQRRPLGVPPWLGLLLAVYLVGPIAAFAVALLDGSAGRTPGAPAGPGLGHALGVSLLTATIATAVTAVVGVPLAYLFARSRSKVIGAVGVLVQLPIALPPLISGLLLLAVVGPYTPLGRLFGGRLTDDLAGIVLAQIFVSAPFLIVAARSAFAAVDPGLEDVAATLGRRSTDRLLRVVVPAAGRGIAAGLVLAWLRAFGEFGATVVLAYHPYSLPIYTFVQFGSAGLRATVAPLAATLATAAAVVTLVAGAGRLRRRRLPELPVPRRPGLVTDAGAAPLAFDVTGHVGGFRVDAASAPVRRLAVLGRSGAGKTLLLRLLVGLAPSDAGRVTLGRHDLWEPALESRRIGYLPQHDAFVPGRPVWRQVLLGDRADAAAAAWWLRQFGLEGFAGRRPDELSGGQRRRVALVRALASHPRLLVLDEPFTGLDAVVRDDLRRDLRWLQQQTCLTTILVTHDPDDAALLSDQVIVLDEGQVLAHGPLGELRRAPPSPQVARLLGLRNVFSGRVAGPATLACEQVVVPAMVGDLPVGSRVTWHVPPAGVRPASGGVTGRVLDVVDWGGHTMVVVRLAAAVDVTMALSGPSVPEIGDRVPLAWEPHAVRVWSAEAGPSAPAPQPAQGPLPRGLRVGGPLRHREPEPHGFAIGLHGHAPLVGEGFDQQ